MDGKITLSRYNSNYEDKEPIHIKLEDESSGVQFIDISMTLENFALMLTNLGYIDCEFQLRGLDNVGKQREHKVEYIPMPKGFWMPTKEDAITLIKPFEVDGWMGSVDDVLNHHNHDKKEGCVRVGFIRWTDKSDILSQGE